MYISYSKSGVPKNYLVKLFLGRENYLGNFIRSLSFKIFGRNNIERISFLFLKDNKEIDKKTLKQLNIVFKNDISNLELLLQKDLADWKINI